MVGRKFENYMVKKRREANSRLILALDVSKEGSEIEELERKSLSILDETSEFLAGVKVGYSLVLNTGLEIITKIKENYDIPLIADFKIADVPHISRQIAELAYDSGADAVISHGFTGRDSLEEITKAAAEMNDRGVLVVSNMSHPGGEMFIQPVSDKILDLAKEAGGTGIVGPATRPEEVEELRSKAGDDILIFTPGIGAQGGEAGVAVKHGADYEIVGRAIYQSDFPGKSAEEIRDEINDSIE